MNLSSGANNRNYFKPFSLKKTLQMWGSPVLWINLSLQWTVKPLYYSFHCLRLCVSHRCSSQLSTFLLQYWPSLSLSICLCWSSTNMNGIKVPDPDFFVSSDQIFVSTGSSDACVWMVDWVMNLCVNWLMAKVLVETPVFFFLGGGG